MYVIAVSSLFIVLRITLVVFAFVLLIASYTADNWLSSQIFSQKSLLRLQQGTKEWVRSFDIRYVMRRVRLFKGSCVVMILIGYCAYVVTGYYSSVSVLYCVHDDVGVDLF